MKNLYWIIPIVCLGLWLIIRYEVVVPKPIPPTPQIVTPTPYVNPNGNLKD